MPRFFALTRITHAVCRIKILERLFCTARGWRLLIFMLVATLGFANIISVSLASTRGYQLKKLDQRIIELKKTNQKINLETSNISSPQVLEETAKKLGMVIVKETHYLSPTTGVLVSR